MYNDAMTNVRFRNEGMHYRDRGEVDENQLSLPIDIGTKREVHWLHGVQQTRRRLIGTRVVTHLVMNEDTYLPEITYIDTDDIAELKDPNLRYALRFADAAASVGWVRESSSSSSCHNVTVIATNEGVDSTLLSTVYTGISDSSTDTFMKNLHDAAPRTD
jgi:hypothetical protein